MAAPTSTIVTVTIVRPLKVMAFVCGLVALFLLIISGASTDWSSADEYRQGLWEECSLTAEEENGCSPNKPKAWIQACAALSVICMAVTFTAAILIAVGLVTKASDRKFTFYKTAMYFMFFAALCIVICLIVFPIMFMQEIKQRGKDDWQFNWAYGVAWGGAVFCFGSAILLLIDKESEEIFYKEKTYYGEADA